MRTALSQGPITDRLSGFRATSPTAPGAVAETIECYADCQNFGPEAEAFGDRAPLFELAAVFPELSVKGMVNAHWHVAYLCLAQMAQGLCYFAAGKILSQREFF